MKRVTIRDIARASGVSTSTVSLIINKKTENLSLNRRMVRQTIRKYNYQPMYAGVRAGNQAD
jgi:DNA-binding LacI/PurR family transcriptional regulator